MNKLPHPAAKRVGCRRYCTHVGNLFTCNGQYKGRLLVLQDIRDPGLLTLSNHSVLLGSDEQH